MPPAWHPPRKCMELYCNLYFTALDNWRGANDYEVLKNRIHLIDTCATIMKESGASKLSLAFGIRFEFGLMEDFNFDELYDHFADLTEENGDEKAFRNAKDNWKDIFQEAGLFFQSCVLKPLAGFSEEKLAQCNVLTRRSVVSVMHALLHAPNSLGKGSLFYREHEEGEVEPECVDFTLHPLSVKAQSLFDRLTNKPFTETVSYETDDDLINDSPAVTPAATSAMPGKLKNLRKNIKIKTEPVDIATTAATSDYTPGEYTQFMLFTQDTTTTTTQESRTTAAAIGDQGTERNGRAGGAIAEVKVEPATERDITSDMNTEDVAAIENILDADSEDADDGSVKWVTDHASIGTKVAQYFDRTLEDSSGDEDLAAYVSIKRDKGRISGSARSGYRYRSCEDSDTEISDVSSTDTSNATKKLFVGKVTAYAPPTSVSAQDALYRILWEDGDSCDFDEDELAAGVALHHKYFKPRKGPRKDGKTKSTTPSSSAAAVTLTRKSHKSSSMSQSQQQQQAAQKEDKQKKRQGKLQKNSETAEKSEVKRQKKRKTETEYGIEVGPCKMKKKRRDKERPEDMEDHAELQQRQPQSHPHQKEHKQMEKQKKERRPSITDLMQDSSESELDVLLNNKHYKKLKKNSQAFDSDDDTRYTNDASLAGLFNAMKKDVKLKEKARKEKKEKQQQEEAKKRERREEGEEKRKEKKEKRIEEDDSGWQELELRGGQWAATPVVSSKEARKMAEKKMLVATKKTRGRKSALHQSMEEGLNDAEEEEMAWEDGQEEQAMIEADIRANRKRSSTVAEKEESIINITEEVEAKRKRDKKAAKKDAIDLCEGAANSKTTLTLTSNATATATATMQILNGSADPATTAAALSRSDARFAVGCTIVKYGTVERIIDYGANGPIYEVRWHTSSEAGGAAFVAAPGSRSSAVLGCSYLDEKQLIEQGFQPRNDTIS